MPFTCLLQGSDTLTIHCGKMLLEAGHQISAVITSDQRVKAWAKQQGISTHATNDTGSLTTETDWLLSIANTDVIPDSILSLARHGGVNFHDGPLPRYAGLNAPVWALLNGETTHGITWHVIEGGIDEGAVVASKMFDVAPGDTALTLNAKCFSAAIECFDEVILALDAGLPSVAPQDLSQRTYFGLNDRPDGGGLIDFSGTADDIVRLVQALDHGTYRNPLSAPKIVVGNQTILVGKAAASSASGTPGTVIEANDTALTIATSDGAVVLSGFADPMGAPIDFTLEVGTLIVPAEAKRINAALKSVLRAERRWQKRFGDYRPALWCSDRQDAGSLQAALSGTPEHLAKAFAVVVSSLTDFEPVDLALGEKDWVPGATLPWRPVRFDPMDSWSDADAAFSGKLDQAVSTVGISVDLPARCPEIEQRVVPDAAITGRGAIPGVAITLATDNATLHADLSRISEAEATLIAARVTHLAGEMSSVDGASPVRDMPVVPPSERKLLLNTWNATDIPYAQETCIHQHFQAQAKRTPNAPALTFRDQTLTYSELNARANKVAHVLKDMGVGPGKPVGLYVQRSAELLIGALGIMKAGGAYLPLDPDYPQDRIDLFIEDSRTEVIVSDVAFQTDCELVRIDGDQRITDASDTLPEVDVKATDLAYMIYTSGSTGRPKGVMIEHRNVSNFFTGMDVRVNHEPAGVLLAVTSLSFDISVLELFWTLARGFRVVLSDAEKMVAGGETSAALSGSMDFSLFYWGNDDGVGRDKYALLLEGAKFADKNGFCAIWTPERHFHAFGGLYPNPSVTGAAVAAVTENIAVRAGSCVAPLHHPARIAEEWAVIDNLTNGRAGLAIASGWQPNDFVLRPENTPPNNKPAMMQSIADIRSLWRGDEVEFTKADGTTISCLTQPRPVSSELPIWVTTAGNPETWRQAGEIGANVLTHLLGQTIEEVGEKIVIYHDALRAAGHDPDDFTVTLMLHTFIGHDRETVREIAREPMKDYLRSAADLIKQYAWAFPAFKKPDGVDDARQLDLGSLEKDELEAILDFAFERYFEKSGLFGTIDDAMDRVREVRAIGVSEVACLIDYGIDRQTVLDGLRPLAEVVARSTVKADYSLASMIKEHGVTHLQCTPYMARMLVTNDASRIALADVKHLMIGGEALSSALVADLETATAASIENMYGPTETTIWSTTATANGARGPVRIGKPISNTHIYVLDDRMEPVPVGVSGELYIGGEGVARGYWGREDLTAERFLDDPFRDGQRMFRTGDLAKWHADGQLEFIGRGDTQVKIRGYRIELGEIEAALAAEDGVTEAVVIVRKDASGVGQLLAYIIGDAEEGTLKQAVAAHLPTFMVPNRIMKLDAFPLTPNKKVDRKALPVPGQSAAPVIEAQAPSAAPAPIAANTSEPIIDRKQAAQEVTNIWHQILRVDNIAPTDNFFDLGGHSLLAVEAHRAVRERLDLPQLSIADIFGAPTLGGFISRVEALISRGNASAETTSNPAPAADATISRRKALRQRREQHH